MNLIVWPVVGAALGKLACVVMRVEDRASIAFSMFVGVIGALLSGRPLTPLFGIATTLRDFSAVMLLALSGYIARGRTC